MSIDQSQVRVAVAAVTDPELRRPLGELGVGGGGGGKGKRVVVDIALPVGHYPQVDELVGRVRLAVSALDGVDEVVVEQTLMGGEDRARVPMLHKALEQRLVDAYWGEPDYLLVDKLPGTGDVTLSLGQYLTKTEVFVVTTPQPAAQRVAQRSAYEIGRASCRERV